VIQQYRDVVILMKVFTHPPRIPPQGAGNLPIVIQPHVTKYGTGLGHPSALDFSGLG
jgi:hypothetical protein